MSLTQGLHKTGTPTQLQGSRWLLWVEHINSLVLQDESGAGIGSLGMILEFRGLDGQFILKW